MPECVDCGAPMNVWGRRCLRCVPPQPVSGINAGRMGRENEATPTGVPAPTGSDHNPTDKSRREGLT
jgi:hypothetical protein